MNFSCRGGRHPRELPSKRFGHQLPKVSPEANRAEGSRKENIGTGFVSKSLNFILEPRTCLLSGQNNNYDDEPNPSLPSPLSASHGERATIDHIVSDFFAKSLHIILDSRIPGLSGKNNSDGPPSEYCGKSRSSDPSFNLEMECCPAVVERVEAWGRLSSGLMVVDVLLQQPTAAAELPSPRGWSRFYKESSPSRNSSGDSWNTEVDGCSSPGGYSTTLLERWIVQYELKAMDGDGEGDSSGKTTAVVGEGDAHGRVLEGIGGGLSRLRNRGTGKWGPPPSPSRHIVERPVVYKRTVIMLRSLYCTARALPSYRLFRLVNSSSHCRSFTLSYKVSSSTPPLPHVDSMMTHSLTPVETLWGRMCVSVSYRETTAVTALEISPSILPRIISDYVGSRTTDPLMRFSSVGSLQSAGIAGRREVHVVSLPSSVPNSPSGASFARRHSWSGGEGKVQLPPVANASRFSRSPSPSQPSVPNPSFPLPLSPKSPSPSANNRQHSPQRDPTQPAPFRTFKSQLSAGILSFSQQSPSPPLSASPSSSTSNHYQGEESFQGPGSAPMSMPRNSSVLRPGLATSPRLLISDGSPQEYQRSSSLSPQGNENIALFNNSRLSLGQVPHIHVPVLEGKISSRLSISTLAESSLLISPPHPYHGNQVARAEEDEEGPPSGVKRSLYGPQRLILGPRGLSEGISDDVDDDDEFCYPFAVSDDEAEECHGCNSFVIIDSPRSVKQYLAGLESMGQPHHRLQDAAGLGALVRVLKYAPPLGHYSRTLSTAGSSSDQPQAAVMDHTGFGKLKVSSPRPINRQEQARSISVEGSPGSCKAVGAKTSLLALEELGRYIDMRDHLLRQGGDKLTPLPGKPK